MISEELKASYLAGDGGSTSSRTRELMNESKVLLDFSSSTKETNDNEASDMRGE